MDDELRTELETVRAELAAEVAARHPDDDGRGVAYLLSRHLPELTGVSSLCTVKPPVASWRNGTLVVAESAPANSLDHIIYGSVTSWTCDMSTMLTKVSHAMVEASESLRASPHRRVVLVRDFRRDGPILLVGVAIHHDMATYRAALPTSTCGPVAARLLHDVLSLMHGRDRLVAAFVCKGWRRATCDFELPVTNDDVRIWVAPRLDEMKTALPQHVPTELDVTVIWMLTKRWLRGCS
jgi:hypothetical protein